MVAASFTIAYNNLDKALAGDCSPTDIKVGEIRGTAARLAAVWVRSPLTALRLVVAA